MLTILRGRTPKNKMLFCYSFALNLCLHLVQAIKMKMDEGRKEQLQEGIFGGSHMSHPLLVFSTLNSFLVKRQEILFLFFLFMSERLSKEVVLSPTL
jgi:hypothetical protein